MPTPDTSEQPASAWMGEPVVPTPRRQKSRYWLHGLLFLLTGVTTTLVGAQLQFDFAHNRPEFASALDEVWGSAPWASVAGWGLPFSCSLLAILLAHEFGHYGACVRYGVDASLPYFLPAPTLIGTLGAFIRIRRPIYRKSVLFDVGVAGPLAGFILLLPLLWWGVAHSKVVPGIAQQGDVVFGTPLILRLLESWLWPGVAQADLALHPVARAAWVGVFATALNLLPVGQLDGGHLIYSFFGEWHRPISRIGVVVLFAMGMVYWPWYLWSTALFLFALRHPFIHDEMSLGRVRVALGMTALTIFLVSFMPVPVTLMAR